jgi:hypothetical protein
MSLGHARALDELDLAGVVDVVQGDAADEHIVRDLAAWREVGQAAGVEVGDGCAELVVLGLQQAEVVLPDLVVERGVDGEPVAAGEGEAAAGLVQQPAADGVFPVGAVEDDFSDVVPTGGGTADGIGGGEAAETAAEIGAVPGLAVVGFVEEGEEQCPANSSSQAAWARRNSERAVVLRIVQSPCSRLNGYHGLA